MNSNTNKSSGVIKQHFLSFFLIMLLTAFIVGSGCDNPFSTEIIEDTETEENGNIIDNDSIPEVNKIPDEEKTLNVALFFGDDEAINMGNPGEYGYVKEVTKRISYEENGDKLLEAALKELISGPESIENGLSATVSPDTKILDITIDEDNNAIVDLSHEAAISTGGTMGGVIFTQSMVYTATQFPSVDTLQITVEGSPWSDGHTVWETPIGRDDL